MIRQNLLIETILMSVMVLGLYAIQRRAAQLVAWAAVVGGAFMVVMVMISPVFIAPCSIRTSHCRGRICGTKSFHGARQRHSADNV